MTASVSPCDLESINFTEEYILGLEAFLSTIALTAFEAQIVLEVSKYPSHHVDVPTIARKISKSFNDNPANNLAASVKSLLNRGYLDPYEGKKDELCVHCSKLGRDTARDIQLSCFSEALKHYDAEKAKIDERKRKLCVDPIGLKVGQKRSANGPKGKIEIIIDGLYCSDKIFSVSESRTEYERRVVARLKCPVCGNANEIEYEFNPNNIWREHLKVVCINCSYTFYLSYYLMKYYDSSL